MARDEELTGRRRHRVQQTTRGWGYGRTTKTVLVLQVERKYLSSTYSGGSIDSEWLTDWRDARVSDLTVEGSTP